MPHERDANPICKLPIDEMVGKPLQIHPVKPRFGEVEAARIRGSSRNETAQLRLELLTQSARNLFIAPHRLRHVALDGGMILHPHWRPSASTRRQNSASLRAFTCPLSISISRRSTSAISSASVI